MTKISNVRKTTKFKRSIKAISPVIATLLMIAIAVVASLVVYAWVTGYIGGTTSKTGKAINIPSIASVGGHLYVYVQNVGQGQVALKQQESLYVNDNLVPITLPVDPITINPGQIAELQTAFAFAPGDKANIKVTTTDGTFMTVTGTATSISNASPTPSTPPVQYAVNFVLGSGGLSMNPTAGSQNVGGSVPITATASTGNHFTSWSSTGSITFADANAASTTATVSGAGSITANFAADTVQYSVSFALGANGATITPTTGPHTYNSGDVVSISATANSGYHFSSWSSSTGSITFANANSAATTATIGAAGTVTANFAADIVAATKLVFSAGAPQTLTAGVVSPTAIVIQRQDVSNNPVSTGAPAITVTLTTGSSGGAFYSNAGGTTVITSITIAAGSSSSAGFYYKDTVATSPTLTGASSGLTSATTPFTINAAAASKLVYTVVDSSIQHNTMSTVFTVQRQDQYNNPTTSGSITVNLDDGGSNAGTHYSDSAGNNAITTLTISAGSSSGNFYYRNTSTTTPRTLTAASTGLTTASVTVTIT